MPKRCALGCPFISGIPYHQFPNPVKNPDRFKAWVCIAGGKLDSQDEIELYRKKVVCNSHFTDKDKNRNNRLNCLAVPSLHLDGKADEVDSADKEVRYIELSEVHSGLAPSPEEVQSTSKQNLVDSAENSKSGLSDHETSTQVPESELILSPSTSYEVLIGLSDYKTSTHVSPMSETILDLPSPIRHESYLQIRVPGLPISGALDITTKTSPILKCKDKSLSASRQIDTVMCPDWINNADNLKEHNYCARDKIDIRKAGEFKYHQPTPPLIVNQLQTARKKVRQLQSEVIRLRKRNKIVKTRLINAKKNSKHNCLQKITQNMTTAAKIFTHMQFTQTLKRNGGRRFTLEGQELSLSIYKSSPQCYDLLTKLFTLPSVKTLKRFRKQIDIQHGLNNGPDVGRVQPGTF